MFFSKDPFCGAWNRKLYIFVPEPVVIVDFDVILHILIKTCSNFCCSRDLWKVHNIISYKLIRSASAMLYKLCNCLSIQF